MRDPRFTSLEDLPDAPPVETIERLSGNLPEGAADLDHAIECELMTSLLQSVMDEETKKFIEERTSTKIELKDQHYDNTEERYTVLQITGPLLSTYLAHFLVMQRVHEHKVAEDNRMSELQDEDKKAAEVAELKAQVARLQEQLRNADKGEKSRRPAGRR